mmetsp:Transcript_26875/g.65314  ORF Transcript_26875/g.65314 Transcript_26875/m.65314 type:complete len:212 (-) Transcript_26875:1008-1643(-)
MLGTQLYTKLLGSNLLAFLLVTTFFPVLHLTISAAIVCDCTFGASHTTCTQGLVAARTKVTSILFGILCLLGLLSVCCSLGSGNCRYHFAHSLAPHHSSTHSHHHGRYTIHVLCMDTCPVRFQEKLCYIDPIAHHDFVQGNTAKSVFYICQIWLLFGKPNVDRLCPHLFLQIRNIYASTFFFRIIFAENPLLSIHLLILQPLQYGFPSTDV